MALPNMTIVQVALPRIIRVFGATVDQGQLVITAYILAMAIVMPATGYAADTFGTKRTYLTTIGLFTLATALCRFAPSIEGLIAFRVIQGLSGGMIMTLGMSIVFQVSPSRQRGSIMGLFGLPVLVAPMVGPIVGGYTCVTSGSRRSWFSSSRRRGSPHLTETCCAYARAKHSFGSSR